MKRLACSWKYPLTALFLLMVQLRFALAQAVEGSLEEYPLNPSPLRVVLYILLSFVVIVVVFKLLYKPKKKRDS